MTCQPGGALKVQFPLKMNPKCGSGPPEQCLPKAPESLFTALDDDKV